MVALLHPAHASPSHRAGDRPAARPDQGPSPRQDRGRGTDRGPGAGRPEAGVGGAVPDRHLRLIVGGAEPIGPARVGTAAAPSSGVAPLPIGSVLAVALVVFGLLGAIRIVQGSPGGEAGVEGSGSGAAVSSTPAESIEAGPGDRVVVVRPGDTLWSIASGLTPGEDPRPAVVALEAANGGPSLQIGQQIVIPEQLLD